MPWVEMCLLSAAVWAAVFVFQRESNAGSFGAVILSPCLEGREHNLAFVVTIVVLGLFSVNGSAATHRIIEG